MFTNNYQLWNAFNKARQPKLFSNFQEYSQWLTNFSKELKIINFAVTQTLSDLVMESKSELKNLEKIHVWWNLKKQLLPNIDNYLYIYNLYNYILYTLSNNSPRQIPSKEWNKYFQKRLINQLLSINIESHRAKSHPKHINYYTISAKQERWKYIKPSTGKIFYKIDYRYSYVNLLFNILGIQINEDPYLYLGRELGLQDFPREEIKSVVFNILFSNKIKQFLNINILNKIYNFSLLLEQQYKNQGYIQSVISEKKIRFKPGERYSRTKLLNMFVMALESETYIGLLYQLLLFPRDKIKPLFFIFDAIIIQVDMEKCMDQIENLEKVLTLNGLFPISRYLGVNLYEWEKV